VTPSRAVGRRCARRTSPQRLSGDGEVTHRAGVSVVPADRADRGEGLVACSRRWRRRSPRASRGAAGSRRVDRCDELLGGGVVGGREVLEAEGRADRPARSRSAMVWAGMMSTLVEARPIRAPGRLATWSRSSAEQPRLRRLPRRPVGASIAAFLGGQEAVLRALDPAAAPLLERGHATSRTGGKRLRPAFCGVGVRGGLRRLPRPAGGRGAERGGVAGRAARVGAHARRRDGRLGLSDGASRRPTGSSRPTTASSGVARRPRGSSDAPARSCWVTCCWSGRRRCSGASGLGTGGTAGAVYPHLEAVRTEVTTGQYLDVVAQSQRSRTR
jgi:hypothetical protein